MAVEVYRVRLRDGVASLTDGVSIWVDDRLNEVQERCAVEHELEHVARGQGSAQTEPVEMSVRYAVACRLLPFESMQRGCHMGGTLAAIARELRVTRQVLMDRAATLDDQQSAELGCRECQACPVMAARYTQHPAGARYRIAA